MTSLAGVRWGLVFWEQDGRAYAGLTGPETRTGTAPVPEGATFTGAVPTPALVDGGVGAPRHHAPHVPAGRRALGDARP